MHYQDFIQLRLPIFTLNGIDILCSIRTGQFRDYDKGCHSWLVEMYSKKVLYCDGSVLYEREFEEFQVNLTNPDGGASVHGLGF